MNQDKGRAKLVGWIVLFAFTGLALLGVLGQIATAISPIIAYSRLERNLAHVTLSEAEVVTLGSSHDVAILPSVFGQSLTKLSTPRQNFDGSLFLWGYFQQYLPEVDYVLLPVSILSLNQKNQVHPMAFKNLANFDESGSFGYRLEYDPDIFIRSWAASYARVDSWEAVLRKLLDIDVERERPSSPFIKDFASLHVEQAIDESSRTVRRNIEKIKKLIDTVNNSGACMIFFESPVSYSYRQRFEELRPQFAGWKDDFSQIISETNDACVFFIPDVWPVSHSKDPHYYNDQHHLSRKGAELFSPMLRTEVDKLLKSARSSFSDRPRKTS